MYQPEQPVSNKDKVCLAGILISDDGMHASHLEVGRYHFQVVVYPAQVRLLKLHPYVMRDEVNRDDILFSAAISKRWSP